MNADAGAADRAAKPFATLKRGPTLSDEVVDSITDAVLSGKLNPGDQLPSERDLADQFGVSRTVVREAIRSLVAQGIVDARSGRRVRVSTTGPDALNRLMSIFLQTSAAIDYPRVHQVRTALEIHVASIAAVEATDEDLAELRAVHEQLCGVGDDVEQAAQYDVGFHRAIAAATHNELFVVLLGSIDDVLLEARRTAFAAPGLIEYAIKAHAEILDNLERRDADGAAEAMRAHLDRAERLWSGAGLVTAG